MRQADAKGIGLLVGMIIGAGMFALPYAVLRGGLVPSIVSFAFAAFLVTSVHLLYGDVLYHNHERHRLPGYVREYMGRGWYILAFASRLFSYYGYLLVYGVLAGIFLAQLIPSASARFFGTLYFVVLAPFLLLDMRRLGTLNLILTIPLVLFVAVLFLFLVPSFRFEGIPLFSPGGDWLLPYGIFLFAFSGASAIPEVVDIFRHRDKRAFRRVVVSSSIIAALVYLFFIMSVVGVAGGDVAEHALSSLKEFAPWPLFAVGVLIGLLAITTSYFALGLELRYTFQYDLFETKIVAWFATAVVPLILYLIGVNDFVLILSIIGAVGVGVEGILIAVLARRLIHTGRAHVALLVGLFSLGAALECLHVLGFI